MLSAEFYSFTIISFGIAIEDFSVSFAKVVIISELHKKFG